MKRCVGWLCTTMLALANFLAFGAGGSPTSPGVGDSLPADFPSIRNPYLGVPVLGFGARGRVAYARAGVGMGIVFTAIQSRDRTILEDWIADLGSKQ